MSNPKPLGFDTSVHVHEKTQLMIIVQRKVDEDGGEYEQQIELKLEAALALSVHINEWLKKRAGV